MTMNTMKQQIGTATSLTGAGERHAEGELAKTIEEQTAKLPSDVFLWAAGAAVVGALTLKTMGKAEDALFVGQWAAPFLLLGVYNKIVKVAGSDQATS